MKTKYIKIENLMGDSKTYISISESNNKIPLWNSSFNPTFCNDILSQPITDNLKEFEKIDKNNKE